MADCVSMNIYSDIVYVHRLKLEALAGDMAGACIPVRMKNTKLGTEVIVCLGEPHFEAQNIVFAPDWVLNIMGYTEQLYSESSADDTITIVPYRAVIPKAITIFLRPLEDSLLHVEDIRKCLGHSLDGFHVLQEGATIIAKIPTGDTYIYVDKIEPAPLVRLGGEVNIEFISNEHPIQAPLTSVDAALISVPSGNGDGDGIGVMDWGGEASKYMENSIMLPKGSVPSESHVQPVPTTAQQDRDAVRRARLRRFDQPEHSADSNSKGNEPTPKK